MKRLIQWQIWQRIDVSCHKTQHANLNDSSSWYRQKPQATNRLGNREGIRLNVFTLSLGEFSWKLGLLVAATIIAASEEAWSKGNEHCWLAKRALASLRSSFCGQKNNPLLEALGKIWMKNLFLAQRNVGMEMTSSGKGAFFQTRWCKKMEHIGS